ncbi:MAG TPA: hypothetical protein VH092_32870 [Urbifossiella sp.]|jgi:hypothetical protein|nr:hypothetical protein [Urbifossiella sp.]
MNRGLGVGVCAVAAAWAVAGCQAPPVLVEKFPEPSRAGGAWVVLDDRRPDWEKTPFSGPIVTMYRFSRVSPSPWFRLQKATDDVVAQLPDKPERVDVVVVAFRIASKDADLGSRSEAGGKVRPVGGYVSSIGTGQTQTGVGDVAAYEQARTASANGDARSAKQALGVLTAPGGALSSVLPVPSAPVDQPETAFDGLPPGATCSLRGIIRLTYPGGRDRDVPFNVQASQPNITGTRYWGETLEEATRQAIVQYTFQFRQGVGLPPGD